jgi:HEAT repeat protein
MENLRNTVSLSLMTTLLCAASSCQQNNKPDMRAGRTPGPSQQAPTYAAARNIALDPSLRASAEKELETDLQSTNAEIRAHALEGLQKAGSVSASEVTRALTDSDPLVRYAACLAAGQTELKSAHDVLIRVADDDHDAAVRVAARYALHRIGDYRFSHDLEKLSRDPQPQVRGTTAMVLGMIGDPSGLKILTGMRTDPHPAVRQQAAAAMWQLGSEQGMADLIGWSISRFPDDDMFGFLALAEPRNRTIIQHVRVGLVSEYPEVSLVAARAMGMLGSDEGYAVAAKGAASSDPRRRLEAAVALGAIARSDAQDVLRKLLADSDTNVRIASAGAILQLKANFMPG